MLSYRHAYHAGNSADVLKHFVIERILNYLVQKDKPCFYLDTHAGAGIYSLQNDIANITSEYKKGIALVLSASNVPPEIQPYIGVVKKCMRFFGENTYPGSPWVAATILRECDRLALCEMHPQDFPLLENLFVDDVRVKAYFEDGFGKSLALAPPKERRGLIIIDPSYEIKADYEGVVKQLKTLHKKFSTGIFALWYPVVDTHRISKLTSQLKSLGIKNTLKLELQTQGAECGGMFASGMMVLNAPWGLKADAEAALPWLTKKLSQDQHAKYLVELLVGE